MWSFEWQAIELFVIMGLTWVVEFGVFAFTDKKAPPPESAVIIMNFVNIIQVDLIPPHPSSKAGIEFGEGPEGSPQL